MSGPGSLGDRLRRGLAVVADGEGQETEVPHVPTTSNESSAGGTDRSPPTRSPEVRRCVQDLLEHVGLGAPRDSRLTLEMFDGQELDLDPLRGATFGRVAGPGRIGIPSRDVSRLHATLRHADGGWVVSDNGSTNGSSLVRRDAPFVLVAGVEVGLLDGDIIEIPSGSPVAKVRIR